jgi:hypothetical protein
VDLGTLEAGEAVEVRFAAPMNLGYGPYAITAAIHADADHTETCYDWIEHAATFHVLPSPAEPFTGICRLEMRIDHARESANPGELALAKRTAAR